MAPEQLETDTSTLTFRINRKMSNFDDHGETVIWIPYSGNDDDKLAPIPEPSFKERDLLSASDLRFEMYRAAWTKCLIRVKSIIQSIHDPVIAQATQEINKAYANVLPGLPYPELPVVCIINPSSSSFLNEVAANLESIHESDAFEPLTFTVHVYPSDCSSLATGMKSIVMGFIGKEGILDPFKRRTSSSSLANFDISMLIAWYKAVINAPDYSSSPRPKLVLMLHDFEQFDLATMQDIFYICSMHINDLPFVFVLSLSSPSPLFLQTTYPRSTLTLLHVTEIVVPSGNKTLQMVLQKTFFDPSFEPDIMIGPAVIRYLLEYFARRNISNDIIITIFQLAHMKHFLSDPISILVRSTPSPDVMAQIGSFPFLDALTTRLSESMTTKSQTKQSNIWRSHSVSSVIQMVDTARMEFFSKLGKYRVGFGIFILLQDFMVNYKYKALQRDHDPDTGNLCEMMIDVLKGRAERDIQALGSMILKLDREQVRELLNELHQYFSKLSSTVRSIHEEERTKLVLLRSRPTSLDDKPDGTQALTTELRNWLEGYLQTSLSPLEHLTLWDVWYTGNSPFPAELLSPSLRSSVISGILRPHDYIGPVQTEFYKEYSLSDLPDLSILFKRYLDSGRMINVYDWFESFQAVLESQRNELIAQSDAKKKSPKKTSGRPKSTPVGNTEVEDEERWKFEVQARFMRAMHELDYLGFIKHTGRKADHVIRTVFEIGD